MTAEPSSSPKLSVVPVPCVEGELHFVSVAVVDVSTELSVTCTCHADELNAVALAFGDPTPRLCGQTAETINRLWNGQSPGNDRVKFFWAGIGVLAVLSAWAAGGRDLESAEEFIGLAGKAAAVTINNSAAGGPGAWAMHPFMRGFAGGITAANLWPQRGNLWTPASDDHEPWLDAFDGAITEWSALWWEERGFDPYTARSTWQSLCRLASSPPDSTDATFPVLIGQDQ